jgi:hypothetical protein
MNRVSPHHTLKVGPSSIATSVTAKPIGDEHSNDQLQNISEKNSRSNSQDSLKQSTRKMQRRSPEPMDLGSSMKIDANIGDLIRTQNLVEVFDILPTAFLLNPKMASEMNRFKKCFADLHIGKGLSMYESIPEKHCKNN